MIIHEFMEGKRTSTVHEEDNKFIVKFYINDELVKSQPAYDEEDAEALAEDWVL